MENQKDRGREDAARENREEILGRLEEKLGHRFRDRALLETALTHRSFAHEYMQSRGGSEGSPGMDHYERLEFLGDSVLSLVVSDLIMKRFPEAPEGELSRIRAGLVCAERLAALARDLGLDRGVRLGKGEEATGGRKKSSILADVFEAVVAALYLDGGLEAVQRAAGPRLEKILSETPLLELLGDYKTPLQELVQARSKTTPYYRVVKEEGPDHAKTFEVELLINGKPVSRGKGQSKKEAEQEAARKALVSGIFNDESSTG